MISINGISSPHKEERLNFGNDQLDDKPDASIFKRYEKLAGENRGGKTCVPYDPSVLQRITQMVDIQGHNIVAVLF